MFAQQMEDKLLIQNKMKQHEEPDDQLPHAPEREE